MTLKRSQAPADELGQLLESLRAESEALIGGDLVQLGQAVQQKEQILRRVAAGLAHTDAARLQQAVRHLRDLNERNARLLARRIYVNRARIESLFGAITGGPLYSADGRAAPNRPAQRGIRA